MPGRTMDPAGDAFNRRATNSKEAPVRGLSSSLVQQSVPAHAGYTNSSGISIERLVG
jgi:hypothetical protein